MGSKYPATPGWTEATVFPRPLAWERGSWTSQANINGPIKRAMLCQCVSPKTNGHVSGPLPDTPFVLRLAEMASFRGGGGNETPLCSSWLVLVGSFVFQVGRLLEGLRQSFLSCQSKPLASEFHSSEGALLRSKEPWGAPFLRRSLQVAAQSQSTHE